MKEKLLITRNFLYRLFLIGFIFSFLAQVFAMILLSSHTVHHLLQSMNFPPFYLQKLLTTAILFVRFFLFYLVLCPAFALHWTIARDKKYLY